MSEQSYDIRVSVEAEYIATESEPDQNRYVFTYTITIINQGTMPARLLSRHWVITDSNGMTQEVRGDGVVGKQPIIQPQESFRYSSGATLTTPVGCMEGSYFMVVREPMEIDPQQLPTFQVPVPAFSLHTPMALN